MTLSAKWKQASRMQKIGFSIFVLAFLYTLTGFFILPALARHYIPKILEKTLSRPVSLKKLTMNPYDLSCTLEGLVIQDLDKEPLLSVGEARVDVKVFKSLGKMALVIREASVKDLLARLVLHEDGSLNISALAPPSQESPQPPQDGEKSKPPRIILELVSLDEGRILFLDQKTGVDHEISSLFASASGISGLADDAKKPGKFSANMRINGAQFSLAAESLVFDPSLQTSMTLTLNGFAARPYLPYIVLPGGRKILSAQTDVFCKMHYAQGEGAIHEAGLDALEITNTDLNWADFQTLYPEPEAKSPYSITLDRFSLGLDAVLQDLSPSGVQVSNARMDVAGLKLMADNRKVLLASAPSVAIKGAHVNGAEALASLESVAIQGGSLSAAMEPGKTLDLARIFELPPGDGAPPGEDGQAAPAGDSASQSPGWVAELGQFDLNGFSLVFQDRSAPEPVSLTVTDMSLGLRDFSTRQGANAQASFSMLVNNRGEAQGVGHFCLDPMAAEFNVQCKNTGLVFLGPYLTEYLNAQLKGADFFLDGKASLAMDQSVPVVRFQGNASVSGFDVATRKDAGLAAWESLDVKGMDIVSQPLSAKIEEVAITGLDSWVVLEQDGTINFASILKKTAGETGAQTEAAAGPPQPAEPETGGGMPDVSIGRLVLSKGRVHFEDRSIEPHFATDLGGMEGTITNISSTPGSRAEINLTAKLDNAAPLDIKGQADVLASEPSGDAVVAFKQIEMAPFSAYTAKHLGYRLQKGKLSLAHHYVYHNGKLDGKNLIVIDQLTLGEKVKSPDAIKAPIELALALLKDRNGRIELDVPIQGDLKDPEFKLGKVITRVLVNIFVKVITSPFAALGALVGGGEELSYVDFTPGSSSLDEEGLKKLEALAAALYDRPALKLDIQGRTDPEKDREAMAEQLFVNSLKTAKKKDMGRKGEALTLAEIVVSDQEREEMLWLAYKEAEFDKEKNALGWVKKIEPPDMERLLRAHLTPSGQDLIQLAWQRARTVQAVILADGKVEAGRIFILEPLALESLDEKTRACRVDFSLK